MQERSSYLARFAAATSVLALILVGIVAAVNPAKDDTTTATAAAAPVPVKLSEFKISPAKITVPYGGSLAVSNTGSMTHNVTVENSSQATADIPAGGQAVLDVSTLSEGTYTVFCSIPGHKDSGMTADLVITGGGSGGMASSEHDMASMGSGGGSTATTAAAGSGDISSMKPGSKEAEAMNKRMEKAMTGGVQAFLDWAKKYTAGKVKVGNTPMTPEVLADGTKRFKVTAAITDWEVSPGKVVKAWTYNGTVPGPWIKVDPGDKVEVVLKNELPISTDIHFHGVSVPNAMDGVAPITQKYIEPGTSFTYRFTAPNHDELGMWHAHMHGQEAVLNGLFADFQVGDVPLPKGRTFNGLQVPADLKVSQEIPMVLNDAGVIGLSLNGKAFPETAPIVAKKGEWIQIDYFNEGLVGHPMHLHRQSQLVIAKDGFALDNPYRMDTLWVAPGERYSVLVKADEVGTWAFHCHILNHSESDDGLTGMVTAMIVQ